jgi:hypothetical protein
MNGWSWRDYLECPPDVLERILEVLAEQAEQAEEDEDDEAEEEDVD